jgi:hypothetical protein
MSTTAAHNQARSTDGTANRRPPARRFTETKSGFKTSEMLVMLLFVAGVLIATYTDDDTLSHQDGWMIAAIVAAAYIVSRGLAKLGVREPYIEER